MKRSSLTFVVFFAAILARVSRGGEIEAFWQDTLQRLSKEPIEAKTESTGEALPYHTLTVTLRSFGGVYIRGRLAVPIQGEGPAEPWPAIVSMPGYSGKQQSVMTSEAQRGYIVFQLYPRGQGDSADLFKWNGDKLTAKLDRPEGAYYQGAYADVVRAIDYVASRSDVDTSRIALVGTSQAGGMALAVASLDPRVKAVVAHVPFLCDMRLAATIPNSLVNHLLNNAARNDEAALQTLDFFDPINLVTNLHAPALVSCGGKDTTCPMATIQAMFDRISSEKTLKVYPNLTHTSCLDFYKLSWTWLDENLGNPKKLSPSSQP